MTASHAPPGRRAGLVARARGRPSSRTAGPDLLAAGRGPGGTCKLSLVTNIGESIGEE